MLIRFFVSNFLSFNEQTEFSMVAGQGVTHPHHVVKGKKRHIPNLLRAGLLYGANGSGKSNFVKAIKFARDFVGGVIEAGDLSNISFKLLKENIHKPTSFQFDVLLNDKTYSYGFEIMNHQIKEEYLYERGAKKERIIFERKNDDTGKTLMSFNISFKNKKQEQFLDFIGMGTPKNTLFLTECGLRNAWEEVEHIEEVKEIHDWINYKIKIIFPDFSFNVSNMKENKYLNLLNYFGTNISHLHWQAVDFDNIQDNLESTARSCIDDLKGNESYLIKSLNKNDLYFFKRQNNEIHSYKLVTQHAGSEATFEFSEESDGTKRLFDFLPIVGFKTNFTVIIDEIDRSLHPHLSRALLSYFLEHQKDAQTQFIATTHEASLLDLDLLRKDEIWFAEKDEKGATALYSLEEFKPRADTEIRRGYLQGRYGAIPFIENFANQKW
jgi:AAA15 family ATPase/GTPase